MKLTAQADFYIEQYGIEEGIKYLKSLGYNQIIYSISGRTEKVFADETSYGVLREMLKRYDIKLLFTIHKEEVYSDMPPVSPETRKAKCLKSLRITANMGCEVMAVRPVALRKSIPNAWEESKRLTYEIYTDMKEEADRAGVKFAFFNNTKVLQFTSGTYSYGCRGKELMELARHFDADVVINPVYALKAGERVDELLVEVKERLLAFGIYDQSQRTPQPSFPMFGTVDYAGLTRFFESYESDAAIVMMYTPIMNRYEDFVHERSFIYALTEAFHEIARLVIGKEEP